ncbi:hypothetical protein Q8F55_004081 [Vanrija albida]|uniref:MARVEL domain-containing protein n=1 Tax=Vanrija albida TaxID=181172 RepID=A0ABR3Q5S9_9TREE
MAKQPFSFSMGSQATPAWMSRYVGACGAANPRNVTLAVSAVAGVVCAGFGALFTAQGIRSSKFYTHRNAAEQAKFRAFTGLTAAFMFIVALCAAAVFVHARGSRLNLRLRLLGYISAAAGALAFVFNIVRRYAGENELLRLCREAYPTGASSGQMAAECLTRWQRWNAGSWAGSVIVLFFAAYVTLYLFAADRASNTRSFVTGATADADEAFRLAPFGAERGLNPQPNRGFNSVEITRAERYDTAYDDGVHPPREDPFADPDAKRDALLSPEHKAENPFADTPERR